MSDLASTLKSLAESKTEGVSKTTTFKLNPSLVTFEDGFNVREDGPAKTAHINRIANAMKAGAFVPPIDVRVEENKIVCVEGECRTRAALLVQKDIPDFTLQARQFTGNDQDRVLHMLGTGNGQAALNPLEQGLGFMRLEKFGMTRGGIAERLGITRMTVDNNIALAEAPKKVQDFIRAGEVSATTVRSVLKQGRDGIAELEKQILANREETARQEKELADDAEKAAKNAAVEAGAGAAPEAESGKKGKGKKKGAKKKAAPKKAPKKKKVTAKKLRGTKAEKKTKKKAAAPAVPPPAENHIRVDLNKDDVAALVPFKSLIADAAALRIFTALENALIF